MLFSMSFDEGDCVLDFHRCLFEYKGRKFMLYPGSDKFHMSIDTFVTDTEDQDKAFELIHEFLYLYGMRNNLCFHFLGASSFGHGDNTILETRQMPFFRSPRRFFKEVSFSTMTSSEASADFMKAISLYNDARYTNDIYYSFLCLYKIIDLPVKGVTRNPANWLNSNAPKIELYKENLFDYINGHSDIGRYIQDECRNALEHVHRTDPGKSSILSFRASDFGKISFARALMFEYAYMFIKNEIGIPKDTEINILKVDKKP